MTEDPRCWCHMDGLPAKLVTMNDDGVDVDDNAAVFVVTAQMRTECPVHGRAFRDDEDNR